MNIIVTGGAGFIGSSFLLRSAAARPDCRFINLDALTYAANPETVSELERQPNVEMVVADVNDRAAVEALMRDVAPDLVVHLAAETHVDRSLVDPDVFWRTNVEGTRNVVEATIRYGAGDARFHQVSTDEVFGSLGPVGRFSETSTIAPTSPYAKSKAAADDLVESLCRYKGLRYSITHCSNNYGPRQFPEKLIPLMILKAMRDEPLPIYGDGLNVRDWLWVDDHTDAIWAVIDKGRPNQRYCVGGDSERTNVEVVEALLREVACARRLSPRALYPLMRFVTDRPGHDRRYAIDASKLRQDTGWVPWTPFEDGIAQTVRWYLDQPAWLEAATVGEGFRAWMDAHYGADGRHATLTLRRPSVPAMGAV